MEFDELAGGDEDGEGVQAFVVIVEGAERGFGLELRELRGEVARFLGEVAAVADGVLELFALGDKGEAGFEIEVIFATVEAAEGPVDAEKAREDLGLEGSVGFEFGAEPGLEDLEIEFFFGAEAELLGVDAVLVGVLRGGSFVSGGFGSGLHA